jgi:hypothetical protein
MEETARERDATERVTRVWRRLRGLTTPSYSTVPRVEEMRRGWRGCRESREIVISGGSEGGGEERAWIVVPGTEDATPWRGGGREKAETAGGAMASVTTIIFGGSGVEVQGEGRDGDRVWRPALPSSFPVLWREEEAAAHLRHPHHHPYWRAPPPIVTRTVSPLPIKNITCAIEKEEQVTSIAFSADGKEVRCGDVSEEGWRWIYIAHVDTHNKEKYCIVILVFIYQCLRCKEFTSTVMGSAMPKVIAGLR